MKIKLERIMVIFESDTLDIKQDERGRFQFTSSVKESNWISPIVIDDKSESALQVAERVFGLKASEVQS